MKVGDEMLLCGDYDFHKPWSIRIPSLKNQYFMVTMSCPVFFFSFRSFGGLCCHGFSCVPGEDATAWAPGGTRYCRSEEFFFLGENLGSYTPGYTNMAGWKMGAPGLKMYVFPIEHGGYSSHRYVSLLERVCFFFCKNPLQDRQKPMANGGSKRRKKRVKRFTVSLLEQLGAVWLNKIWAIEKRAPVCVGYIKESIYPVV